MQYHGRVRWIDAFREIRELAESQAGYVTRAQAAAAGVDDLTLGRLAGHGLLERVDHGVYRLPGADAGPLEELWVAWLRLAPATPAWQRARRPDAIVSHASAARVYDLGVLPADTHEFIVSDRRQSRRPDVRFHRAPVAAGEWEVIDGLPVTRPPRTLSDLLHVGIDGDHAGRIAAEALDRGVATRRELAAALDPHARRWSVTDGAALLEHLLAVAATELAARAGP